MALFPTPHSQSKIVIKALESTVVLSLEEYGGFA